MRRFLRYPALATSLCLVAGSAFAQANGMGGTTSNDGRATLNPRNINTTTQPAPTRPPAAAPVVVRGNGNAGSNAPRTQEERTLDQLRAMPKITATDRSGGGVVQGVAPVQTDSAVDAIAKQPSPGIIR